MRMGTSDEAFSDTQPYVLAATAADDSHSRGAARCVSSDES